MSPNNFRKYLIQNQIYEQMELVERDVQMYVQQTNKQSLNLVNWNKTRGLRSCPPVIIKRKRSKRLSKRLEELNFQVLQGLQSEIFINISHPELEIVPHRPNSRKEVSQLMTDRPIRISDLLGTGAKTSQKCLKIISGRYLF